MIGTMIPVVRCKPEVAFARIAPAGFRILAALDGASKVLGFDMWITAGTDSHTTGRHVTGEAYDISVKDWSVPILLKVKRYLEQVLGDRFTVLYEVPTTPSDPDLAQIAYVNGDATGPHLHVQVKKGSEYPPSTPVSGVNV
jgi:hypothetical protein